MIIAPSTESSSDLSVVLDLGADVRATELDALYIEATLLESGIEAVFYPWHPNSDVLTPLGALRPLKLLVPASHAEEGRALVQDVLASRDEARRDVAVPIADAWVLPYYVGVVVRHLHRRSIERRGFWRMLYWAFAAWLAFSALTVLMYALQPLISLLD